MYAINLNAIRGIGQCDLSLVVEDEGPNQKRELALLVVAKNETVFVTNKEWFK